MRILLALIIMASPFLLYWLVIRPRLKARFVDIYANLDSFWARVRARLYAFRSFVAAVAAAWIAALPDLLQGLTGIDLSFLPGDWKLWVTSGLAIVLLFIRAFATKPRDEPA
jgi:hypothetical protein